MIYSSEQIKLFDSNKHAIAVGRYLHKYFNDQYNFRRLKPHEKDYLFGWMETITNDDGNRVYDLYKIPEAKEYLFNKIILRYGEDVDSFSCSICGPSGKLTANQVRKDKRFFNEYLQIWKKQLENPMGMYLPVIKRELNDKLKELSKICLTEQEYKGREKYCYAVFFYVYYKAKLYFEEKKEKYLEFEEHGYKFIANIYSYCHIFTRHYVPSLNRGMSNTINADIPCIDINNFLESIKKLVDIYFEKNHNLDTSMEYLLYKINGDKYIMWIKYKKLNELCHQEGFEIRSFYRCTKGTDLIRFYATMDVEFDKGCYCCIEKR